MNDDVLEYEEKLGVNTQLEKYFQQVKKVLKDSVSVQYTEKDINLLFFDINNYILTKISSKIYPTSPSKIDKSFYKKCKKLSALKQENFCKEIINENIFNKIFELLDKMNRDSTPIDKIDSFMKAYSILENSITFQTGKKEVGLDDSLNYMQYILVKNCPKRFNSNSKFCELFLLNELQHREYGHKLDTFSILSMSIKNCKHSDLINVPEEFFKNDNDSGD